jgi:Uma2 family endonuclease
VPMQPQTARAPIVNEPIYRISDEELLELNAVSKWYRFERDADGSLIVSPPTGSETSARNAELTHQVATWNEHHGHGTVFDSNGGFVPPNSSMRAPDTSWVCRRRWAQVPTEERRSFAHLAPDLVIELVSQSDKHKRLEEARKKVKTFVDGGSKVSLILDPYRNVVETSGTDLLPPELPAAVIEIPVELLEGAGAPLVLDVPRIFAAAA